ncbi:hypothetical protein [Trichormus azollae]|uniref:hypothetical protein n=1 Tax=Trichormus azollae TaxID=1164 RepID=UPI00019577A6
MATPFISRQPNITSYYVAPIQLAIGVPEEIIFTLKTADQMLKAVQLAFSQNTKFINPQTDAAILERFAYDIDP